MLRAPCPSHDSLDVWSWGNNSPQEQRDNSLPASTSVHSSSRPCATWECPSTRLNLLWSVTGCSGSHWYASKTWPHTSLGEDKWWTSDLRVLCWNVFHETSFSKAKSIFPFEVMHPTSATAGPDWPTAHLWTELLPNVIERRKKNVQIETFCNKRKYVDASHYYLVWLGSLCIISVTCNTKRKKRKENDMISRWQSTPYGHPLAPFFQLRILFH